MKRRAALSLIAALLVAPGPAAPSAAAQPTIWQRAQQPSAARIESRLTALGRLLDRANQVESDEATLQQFRLRTLAIAELSGARELGDPRLLILLARAMLDAQDEREDDARQLLERALGLLGRDEVWLEAEIRALLALAARFEPKTALAAVRDALPLVWEPSARSSLLRERAEAHMALFDVRRSLTDARRALAAAREPVAASLCRFELSLALERAGDLPAALNESHLARVSAPALFGSELGILELADAFTFRPQDSDYAAALAHMAAARRASEPERAEHEYQRAVAAWNRYLEAAPQDRWAPSARAHAANCKHSLARLAERLRRLPPPELEDDD